MRVLSSCQKEVDFANRTSNGNGTSSADDLLAVRQTNLGKFVHARTFLPEVRHANLE